tara:strand:+ start:4681 stop:5130 length:450 start_codon:yes stop_codon:yes gene_type:complete
MMSKGKTQLSDTFEITIEMREWANQKVPRLDIDHYHEEFVDHWMGNGKQMVSWVATWRNWMRRTDSGAAPGLYGPDDKSIKRKQPRAVPNTQRKPTEHERSASLLDHLRKKACALGMDFIQSRHNDHEALAKFINDKECENGRNKADNI